MWSLAAVNGERMKSLNIPLIRFRARYMVSLSVGCWLLSVGDGVTGKGPFTPLFIP